MGRGQPLPPLPAGCWNNVLILSHGTVVPWHSRVTNHGCDLSKKIFWVGKVPKSDNIGIWISMAVVNHGFRGNWLGDCLMVPACPVRYSRTGGPSCGRWLNWLYVELHREGLLEQYIFEDYDLSLPAIVSFRVAWMRSWILQVVTCIRKSSIDVACIQLGVVLVAYEDQASLVSLYAFLLECCEGVGEF